MSTNVLTRTKPKTAVKTGVTAEQSQRLVQTMLTMSFGCLAFLRGLFPDESFVDQRFVPEKIERDYNKLLASGATSSIKIKTLVRGKSEEADLLLDWLEKGVFQSVKLKYVKALSLEIFLDDKDPTNLLESYVFRFEYSQDGTGVSLQIDSKNSQQNNQTISLLDSRKMAQQLMRRFIIITQSLEPLPQRKFLAMRLLFNETAPKNYQPQLFKDATFDQPAILKIPASSELNSSSLGSLDTPHHKLDVKVLSVADVELEDDRYEIIDPFDLVEPQDNSQNTNVLGNLLESSQPSIQPTQLVTKRQTLKCECNMDFPVEVTKLRECKNCARQIHSLCYGNVCKPKIDRCFSCIYGKELDTGSETFKKLMVLRNSYRYLAKSKRGFPASVTSFAKSLAPYEYQIDKEFLPRIAFAISALFKDGIMSIQNNESGTQKQRSISNVVLVDIPGIITPELGELLPNESYTWSYRFSTPNAHPCYTDVIPESKAQINNWLKEVDDLKVSITTSLPSSCDLNQLEITDTNTLDPIKIGQKRKHLDLSQYLQDEGSSIMDDTLDASALDQAPKKVRKISISKKTLRSAW